MTSKECIGLSKCKAEYITKEQALEAIKGKMWPGELEAAIKASHLSTLWKSRGARIAGITMRM